MRYFVERADLVHDKEQLVKLWNRNIPWFTTEEHERRIAWYRKNPCGKTTMFIVRDEKNIMVGSAGIAPRIIQIMDEQRIAGCAVDLAVEKAHRTVQPALLLARAIAGSLSPEMPLIWAHPNEASRGVFMRAGFKDVCQGHTYVKIFDYQNRLLRRRIPRTVSRIASKIICTFNEVRFPRKTHVKGFTLSAYDSALATFLDRKDLLSSLNIVRNPDYLHWVYEESPYRQYVLLGTRFKDNEDLQAVGFCYAKNSISFMDEFLCAPSVTDALGLLEAVSFWARCEGSEELRIPVANEDERFKVAAKQLGFTIDPWRRLLVLKHPSIPPNFEICGSAAPVCDGVN